MGIFFVYILKSSVCLAMFYLFYRLLLSKETFHRFNRVALLGVLVLSCLIPMIEVTTHDASGFLVLEEMILMAEVEPAGVLDETSNPFPWRALMLLVYMAGILFFVIRHLWSLGRMLHLLRVSRKEDLGDGITLFVHDDKEVAPFSWMKNIAVSETDLAESREAVLTHERAHIHNRHSWDLLLGEVCVFFQWFNPAAWLLKQELQTIHEYEADEWVIENGIDAKTYQLLIIKKAVGARLYSIANSFNHSSLKKRITMMIKKKSNPWARLKCLVALPLAAVAVAAFARPEVSNELDEISSAKVNDLTSIVKAEEVKSVENSSDEKFKLSGTVVEAARKNVPVMGASVIIRGTTNGTLTDMDGKFVMTGVKKGDVIQVSFVGYQTQSVVVKDDSPLTILMRDDVQNLEEMTVVGYASDGVGASSVEHPDKKVVAVVDIPKAKEEPQEEVIFQVVEEMPQFPGGLGEAMKFLAKNIKYPVEAQQAKIEGRVIVRFVVGRDGSVSDVEVMRGVSPELDAEAVRVVSMMPKWIPGKQRGKAVAVKYTMPIMFRLQTPAPKKEETVPFQQINLKVDKDASKEDVAAIENFFKNRNDKGMEIRTTLKLGDDKKSNVMWIRGAEDKLPLIIVDDKVMGKGRDVLSEMNPSQIEAISVLKGESAVVEYGDEAKDGAIIIKTKKK